MQQKLAEATFPNAGAFVHFVVNFMQLKPATVAIFPIQRFQFIFCFLE
jgi:hypothetical protein